MFAVQAERTDPGARGGQGVAKRFPNARTYASGLRVPKPFADYLILRYIRASGGTAISVTDDEMRRACDEIGAAEGIFAAPEGGAVWAAAKLLAEGGRLGRSERIVLFNTGSGFKYL
jgi:threonine synthase